LLELSPFLEGTAPVFAQT